MRKIITIAVLIIVWQVTIWITGVKSYIFPAPINVIVAIVENFNIIYTNLTTTLLISITALFIGITSATATAFSMSFFSREGPIIALLLAAFQAIPIVALAPYFMIWFGPGISGRILMAVAVVYVPACFVMWNGLRRIDSDIGLLFRAYNITKWQSFKRFRLYLAAPFILAAIDLTASLSMIGAIIAELAGAPNGVGSIIIRASYSMKTDLVFAVLSISAIVSSLLYILVGKLTEITRKRFAITGVIT